MHASSTKSTIKIVLTPDAYTVLSTTQSTTTACGTKGTLAIYLASMTTRADPSDTGLSKVTFHIIEASLATNALATPAYLMHRTTCAVSIALPAFTVGNNHGLQSAQAQSRFTGIGAACYHGNIKGHRHEKNCNRGHFYQLYIFYNFIFHWFIDLMNGSVLVTN